MCIKNLTLALLVSASILGGESVAATANPRTLAAPRYVYFTLYSNLVARPSPRPELLEVSLDLDLRQLTLREALRRTFAQAKQKYVIDGRRLEDRRIVLQGKGLLLSMALDELVRQAGGRWVQELREGQPVIRIHAAAMPMTIHLPATPE